VAERMLRRMLFLTNGSAPATSWVQAAKDEPPVAGKPKACKACPLRMGGEWEQGASTAIASMTERDRGTLRKRWGCHASPRPCAGMARLTKAVPRG
jgi:hypothetical protein